MLKKTLYLFLILALFESCSFFKTRQETNKKLIARVNNVYLYEDDIKEILPKSSSIDSALVVSNYINSWAKQQLLYSKAKVNLIDDQKQIKKLVAKYEQDLLISKYKEAVISQELNTTIIEKDIETFYNKNYEIFKLNEKLIMFKYIKLRKNVSDLDNIERLFKSDKQEDKIELMANELVYKSFHFNDSTWIKYNDVLKLVPVLNENENKIVPNVFIKTEKGSNVYLVKINKILDRNQLAPKSYVKPTIKQMILHNRKLLLLKDIEKTLLNDATKNGEYEIYN